MAERMISKPRLPKEPNHITDLAQLLKLPGKVFEKPGSESAPAARAGSFKGWLLGPVIAIQHGLPAHGALSLMIMCWAHYQTIWAVMTVVLIDDESLFRDFTSEKDSFKLSLYLFTVLHRLRHFVSLCMN